MNSRPALELNIARINEHCGIDEFLRVLLNELQTGKSLNRIRKNLPYDMSVNKLRSIVAHYVPEAVPYLDLPTEQRRSAMIEVCAMYVTSTLKQRNQKEVLMSLYDANHTLFKYFTPEWHTKFMMQKYVAEKQRGLEFKFDFVSWVMWWVQTGHIDERGTSGYQMCRNNDTGPYAPDNVYCASGVQNREDARRFKTSENSDICDTDLTS